MNPLAAVPLFGLLALTGACLFAEGVGLARDGKARWAVPVMFLGAALVVCAVAGIVQVTGG